MNYTKLRKALGLGRLKTLGVVLLSALTGSFAVGWGVVLVCFLACAALAVLVRSRAHR